MNESASIVDAIDNVDIEIKDSETHGQGVFTTRNLDKGHIIEIHDDYIKTDNPTEHAEENIISLLSPVMRRAQEGKNEMFIDAWFLIFKILRMQYIPDWFFNLHSNRDLAKNLDSIDKEIMLQCMETYPDKKVLDIFCPSVSAQD